MENWELVVRVARVMVDTHFRACELLPLDMDVWASMMEEAVGWVVSEPVSKERDGEGSGHRAGAGVEHGAPGEASEQHNAEPPPNILDRVRATRVFVALPGSI